MFIRMPRIRGHFTRWSQHVPESTYSMAHTATVYQDPPHHGPFHSLGECLPGALLFYLLSRLQSQIYPLMEKPPK